MIAGYELFFFIRRASTFCLVQMTKLFACSMLRYSTTNAVHLSQLILRKFLVGGKMYENDIRSAFAFCDDLGDE
jgi:hypothetical protein